MKRAAILIAALLACASAKAQTEDAALLRRVSFDAPAETADSLTALGRTTEAIGLQLAGSHPFDPGHRTFFREAVREAGFQGRDWGLGVGQLPTSSIPTG